MFDTAAASGPALRTVRLALVLLVLWLVAASPTAYAAGPRGVQVTRDVPYGQDQGEQLGVDVYRMPAAASAPIVMLLHGGGWVSGDKADYALFSRSLAAAGFVVFDVNYSLDLSRSPAYPREVTDVKTALGWVQQHAGEYDGNTNRIAVVGGSAGGYLAAMLGTEANTQGASPLRAVASLSGPMDISALVTELRQVSRSASGECQPISCALFDGGRARLRDLLGCDPLQCPDQLVSDASPITHVTSASPPFFLANSTQEGVPETQATTMAAALQARGVAAETDLVPGTRHGLSYLPDVRAALLTFLTRTLGVPTPAAASAAPGQAQQVRHPPGGHGHAGLIRWLVVAAILCLLASGVLLRRHAARISALARRHRRRRGAGSPDPSVPPSGRRDDPPGVPGLAGRAAAERDRG